jgi:hypothetical protein
MSAALESAPTQAVAPGMHRSTRDGKYQPPPMLERGIRRFGEAEPRRDEVTAENHFTQDVVIPKVKEEAPTTVTVCWAG